MRAKAIGLIVILGVVFCQSGRADNFYFTMPGTGSSNSYLFPDTVPGTLTGEIIGLQDNATSLPTEVIIDTVPVYPGYWNFPTFETGPGSADDGFSADGSFTVTDGEITAADVDFSYQPVSFGGMRASADLEFNFGGSNSASDSGYPSPYFTGANGFSGVTYAPIPEPSSYALILVGLALLFARRKYSKSRQS